MSNLKDLIITNTPTEAGITIPAFGKSKEAFLDMTCAKEAETRALEVKLVNPITFPELEIMVTRAYQELRRNHTVVNFLIAEAEKNLDRVKADALLDRYPAFLEGRPKGMDNADTRKAFLSRDKDYSDTEERIQMLQATESFLDGKIKVMERLSSFMKKQMDLIIRSGLTNPNLYNTNSNKK